MPLAPDATMKKQSNLTQILLALLIIAVAASVVWFIQQQKIDDLNKTNASLKDQISQVGSSAEKQILAVSKAYCIGANIKCDPVILKQLEQHASVNIGSRDLLVSKNAEGTWRVVLGANKGELCSIGADAPGLGAICQ
jgi:uncharacterized protein HemX